MKATDMMLWCIAVPKASGDGEAFIPATSQQHAEGFAERWKGAARVTPWPGDPRVNIQNDKGKAKTYQVKQVLLALDRLGVKP